MEQKAKEVASHAAIPVSISAMLVTLGVVYGDIGTSPMYVTKALVAGNGGIGSVTQEFVLGALSLVVWTVTLLTTVKYVLISLRADNHGEGGIFALYSLVKRCGKWLIIPAMLGGAALLFLADAGFLGAAGLFSTGALLSLRTGAGFGGGLFLGGAAGLSGFGFSASSLLGEHLRILHEDALASHFDRNRTGAAGAVLLLDDALFLARDGDLALSRLRALDAQAVEQARLVGLAQFIRFARLVDARGSKLSQKRLGGHLEFLCEFAYRFAGHKFLSP